MVGSFSTEAQHVFDFTRCQRPNGTFYGTAGTCRKGTESPYADWEVLAQGFYGKVSASPDGTRVVKELLERDGKKGEFGPFERQLAIRMGKLGHAPKIHALSKDHIEMDRAKGSPLWKGFNKGEDEPVMNAQQSIKAGAALRDLHKLGFFHGDAHSQQFLVNGNDVKVVDFGLSGRTRENPVKALQDLSKTATLIRWDNPETQKNSYNALANRTMQSYREIKGQSKAAKAAREDLARKYLDEVASL